MAGWSDTPSVKTYNNKPKLYEEIELMKFPDGEWVSIRLVGSVTSYMQAWLELTPAKDGGKNRKFPKNCLDYDRTKGKLTKDICPYRAADLYMPQRFLTNAIIRDLQEKRAKARPHTAFEKKQRSVLGEMVYVKEKGSKSYTPVRACDFPDGVKAKIVERTALYNKKMAKLWAKKSKKWKNVELSDPKNGCDILVMFDNSKAGAAKWDVQLEERTPLTEEEQNYLVQDIEHLKSLEPESLKVAKEEWARIKADVLVKDKDGKIIKGKFAGKNDDDDDDDDDEDLEEKPKKKKKKLKSKKSSKSDPPWDEDDDKPKKKKSSKEKISSKSSSLKKKSSGADQKAKKKKRKDFEDFEDLD